MQLFISDIDVQMDRAEYYLQRGKSLDSAFRALRSSSSSADFFEPALCLNYLVNWLWLGCHKGISIAELLNSAIELIDRSLEVYGRTGGQKNRGEHDLFLLSTAILIGDWNRVDAVVQRVPYAEESDRRVFYAAVCGMLKARVLKDQQMEQRQFELFDACKGSRSIYRVASRACYHSFVDGREKALIQHCRKSGEQFWQLLKRHVFPDPFSRDGEARFGTWSPKAYWPWPEMTLLKLAFSSRTIPEVDDFWFPRILLQSRSN